jgi:hypothetical protein
MLLIVAACGGGEGEPDDGRSDADGVDDATVEDGARDDTSPEVRPDVPDDGSTPDDATVVVCTGNCRYIRAAAPAGGDGADWTTAWTQLPDTLQRGLIYYVAGGTYPAYEFDDAESAGAVITVLKATAADHGADTGWDVAYGTSRAVFGPLRFAAPDYVVDGQEGLGFQVVADFQGSVVGIEADRVTLRRCELDGAFATDAGGTHTGGACTGLDVSASDVTVQGCEIHDAADDGVSMSGCRNVAFVGNTVHALHACGTDGGCGPCYNGHSDGIEIYDVKDSSFVGNLIYDVRSTSCLFFGNWADSLGGGPDEYCGNILLANNILYSPDTGFVAYIQDVVGADVYNNVFWGRRDGRYGGLSIGLHVTDMELRNNVILSINLDHIGTTYDPAQHRGDYNLIGVSLGQFPEGAHDVVDPDPLFAGIPGADGATVADPTPELFTPTAGSPCLGAGFAGDATIVIPAEDFFGRPRGVPPDIGAIEGES